MGENIFSLFFRKKIASVFSQVSETTRKLENLISHSYRKFNRIGLQFCFNLIFEKLLEIREKYIFPIFGVKNKGFWDFSIKK